MSEFSSDDSLAELAELELLQGFDGRGVALSRRRQELYARFGSTDGEQWATTAKAAYAAMARSGGYVASVGDQLAADVDILENAELYASLGGFSVLEITNGLGSRWSPPAVWFRYGRQIDRAEPTDDDRQLLLRAGAEALARFYARVAGGAAGLQRSSRWLPRGRIRRREIAFIAGVMVYRRDRFLDGPGQDGRYLSDERFSEHDIVEAARGARAAVRVRDRTEA